jgi:hypothetical protein
VNALFLTSQSLITEHWPTASRLLAPVLQAARGEFTVDDLLELCRDGRAVAGMAFEDGEPVMAMVFEFVHFPRKTVLRVIALAGRDLQRIAGTFWPSFTEWAKESGAAEIEACVAPAMGRMLKPLGFTHTYNTVRTPCH